MGVMKKPLRNNVGIVRFGLALLVVIQHAGYCSKFGGEPLSVFTGTNLTMGGLAVGVLHAFRFEHAVLKFHIRARFRFAVPSPGWGGTPGLRVDRISGAGEEIRTLDPNLGKVVLYH